MLTRSVTFHCAAGIAKKDGVPALYRGFLPNALKNLPNKGRCASYVPMPYIITMCISRYPFVDV